MATGTVFESASESRSFIWRTPEAAGRTTPAITLRSPEIYSLNVVSLANEYNMGYANAKLGSVILIRQRLACAHCCEISEHDDGRAVFLPAFSVLCLLCWCGSPFFLNISGMVYGTINSYGKIFAHQFADERRKMLEEFNRKIEMSAAIGFAEQVIYLYALISGFREFIGAILIFKAFNGWLTTTTLRTDALGQADTAVDRTVSGQAVPENLVRFYIYAIGNFISLCFSVTVYELVRYSFNNIPFLKAYLILPS